MEEPIMTLNDDWIDIEGYEGLYQANIKGQVRSLDRVAISTLGKEYIRKGKILKECVNGKGRPVYRLYKSGVGKTHTTHRLVAKAFLPNFHNKPQINHIDGNPLNNNIENLEWVTNQENVIHAFENNLNSNAGEKNPRAKITRHDAEKIRLLYKMNTSKKALAKKYNLSVSGIENIIYNRVWKTKENLL